MKEERKVIDEPARTNMSDRCALAKTRGMFGASFLITGLLALAILISIHISAIFLNLIAAAILVALYMSGIYTIWLSIAVALTSIGAVLKYLEQDDCKAAEYYAFR